MDQADLTALAKCMGSFCCTYSVGNEPCRLNESEDSHEVCLPHLAGAILSGRELTKRERLRLALGVARFDGTEGTKHDS